MIKIAIADDQPIILNGIQKILSNQLNMTVVATYKDGNDLLQGLKTINVDVLLLDIQMPGLSGIELSAIISKHYKNIKILALTNVDILSQVKKMMQNGSSGYLLKDASPDIIIKAINEVFKGKKYIQEEIQKQIESSVNTPKIGQLITRREREILKLIADENTNQEIAAKLFLSMRTVENHRTSLLQKLGVKNTAGLVREAINQGLI
ncbi:response regulator [Polluticaenibacter yanchengensis]|uniref:Response regulator transcription factor n=1 Tax=Polluticaenibacter yanchengensis TaxID=3014562 RepID=A0ABT4UIX1_9BACT|nr:response regulator transcription factor [Chitinophagaceae bacterium LY-5]